MEIGAIVAYILAVVLVNFAVLKTLLSSTTWWGVQVLIAVAIIVQVLAFVIPYTGLSEASPIADSIVSAVAFGITGQILMFFFRNLILVKMRDVRARAFGQQIAPSQGFAKDYLLHIPQMRTEALIVFLIITVVEVAMVLLPRL
ncbi:hypothetical protein BH09BAC1_BH09BAC1_08430 [soil metagenome]